MTCQLPTPAQIEAAAKAMQQVSGIYGLMECTKLAAAALTAAAEVAEKERKADLWKGSRDPQVTVKIADRPAAAEVPNYKTWEQADRQDRNAAHMSRKVMYPSMERTPRQKESPPPSVRSPRSCRHH